MSSERLLGEREEEEFGTTEGEDNEIEVNEYELERQARIAENNLYLQSALEAADAL